MAKNCYFFRDEEGIWVDIKNREPLFIPEDMYVATTGVKNGVYGIHSIKDLRTNKYYYPADDCRKIQ